jgi:hypothetical protein
MKKTLSVAASIWEHRDELPRSYAKRSGEQAEARTQPTLKSDSFWILCSEEQGHQKIRYTSITPE